MSPDPPLPRVERNDPTGDQAKFFHQCTDTNPQEAAIGAWLPTQPLIPTGWAWGPGDSLTPSIRCLECGLHGWWDGEAGWRPA